MNYSSFSAVSLLLLHAHLALGSPTTQLQSKPSRHLNEALIEETVHNTLNNRQVPLDSLKDLWEIQKYKLSIETNKRQEKIYHLTPSSDDNNGGEFFLSLFSSTKTLIQAPHRYFDKHTGKIGLALHELIPKSALFLNSTHRRNTDLAKNKESVFYQLSQYYFKVPNDLKVIQIHGFSNKKRRSDNAKKADIIVSAGSTPLQAAHYKLISCLRRHVSKQTYLYPKNVKELGGKGNVIGILAAKYPKVNFIHIELSLNLRSQLTQNNALSLDFAQCISSA